MDFCKFFTKRYTVLLSKIVKLGDSDNEDT